MVDTGKLVGIDDRYMKGRCMLCHEDKDVRHINMYLIGSEGLDCCHKCEMEILDFCRKKSHTAIIQRKVKYQKLREQRKQRKEK